MVAVVVLALSVILVVYPFFLYPVILRLLPEKPVLRGDVGAATSATLLFCAYNEGAALPAKIANLRMLKGRYPDLEILAYDDGSKDGTGALLAEAADVLTTVTGPGRTGKAHGMKLLAARATGDVLIFTDANVILDREAVERLLPYYTDPTVGGVLGSLRYDGADASASAQVGGFYWRIEERLKDLESRTGNVMGADGSIFSVRRALYPEFPDFVLDDLTVSMNVLFAGRRLIKAKDVIAREAMVAERKDEIRRKIRIAARSWHTHRYLRPGLRRMGLLDRFKYLSRKQVRWFGAIWMATGATAAFVLAGQLGLGFVIALFLLCALVIGVGLFQRRGVFAALIDIALAYIATLQGIILAMRGRDFTTWAPAKSRG
jgi:cellulose synthase/poly-beta-1,6-N-acetylglucosamine synthase-like glycosyltransferase